MEATVASEVIRMFAGTGAVCQGGSRCRDPAVSILQVMSLANHPRVWQKITDAKGRVAQVAKAQTDDGARIEEVFLAALCRRPSESEKKACLKYVQTAESAEKGLQGVMWGLLDTREFLLQH